jgi:hypothetical protein
MAKLADRKGITSASEVPATMHFASGELAAGDIQIHAVHEGALI